jgi:hypothetical protein
MDSKIFIVIIVLLFIGGCNSPSKTTQVPTLIVKPNVTNSLIATATLNFTSTSTATLSPQDLTQIAYRPTFAAMKQTQEYYMNTEIPTTLEARNVKCKDGFALELGLDVIRMSNDRWTVFTCSPTRKNINDLWTPGGVDFGTRYTQIIKTDLSQTWTIQHNTFDYSKIDRPDALLSPYHWSTDGKYLYLYPQYYPGGSGFPQSAFLYAHVGSLYRINLETGEFTLFLKADQYVDLAFSPNDQFLAYSERERPDVIHIRNMETENDLQIKLNEDVLASGAFIWYSDSTKVIFFAGYEKQSDNWQDNLSGTAIFVLSPKNMNVQKILAKDARLFQPYRCYDDHNIWLDESIICLYSTNDELDSWNKFFSFNIKTGEVKFLYSWGEAPTSTPKP